MSSWRRNSEAILDSGGFANFIRWACYTQHLDGLHPRHELVAQEGCPQRSCSSRLAIECCNLRHRKEENNLEDG